MHLGGIDLRRAKQGLGILFFCVIIGSADFSCMGFTRVFDLWTQSSLPDRILSVL